MSHARTCHDHPTAVAPDSSRSHLLAVAPASSASCPGWALELSGRSSPARSRSRSGDGPRRSLLWCAKSASTRPHHLLLRAKISSSPGLVSFFCCSVGHELQRTQPVQGNASPPRL